MLYSFGWWRCNLNMGPTSVPDALLYLWGRITFPIWFVVTPIGLVVLWPFVRQANMWEGCSLSEALETWPYLAAHIAAWPRSILGHWYRDETWCWRQIARTWHWIWWRVSFQWLREWRCRQRGHVWIQPHQYLRWCKRCDIMEPLEGDGGDGESRVFD